MGKLLKFSVSLIAVTASYAQSEEEPARPRPAAAVRQIHRSPLRGAAGPAAAAGGKSLPANGIMYHNGPLLLGTVNLYLIFYGSWGPKQVALLTNWASHIGGSPYFNINTTYSDWAGRYISNSAVLAGTARDSYSLGKSLSDLQVEQVITNAIGGGSLPMDPNGVYFVLASADVLQTAGFCSSFCSYHVDSYVNGQTLKFIFVGNPATQCLSWCAPQTISPNNLPGVDAMVSAATHELVESVTDPQLDGWFFPDGNESADECAWTFGNEYSLSNGSKANMVLGGKQYLIQQTWVNAGGGFCALSY